ncbi:MAG: ATP-binding protein [Myxococcales bacterium]|nr:ATP-binding protein [Myxococcales bacterium]
MDSWAPMPISAALEALRLAVGDGDEARAARYADAAARAGASQAAVRQVILQTRRASDIPPATSPRGDDPERRLAEALELPLIEEREGIMMPLSRAAQRAIGVGFRGDIRAVIATLTGIPASSPLLDDLLARILVEEETTEILPDLEDGEAGYRVVIRRTQAGPRRILVSKQGGAASTALRRRAEEAEVLATIQHEMSNLAAGVAALAKRAADAEEAADEALRRETIGRVSRMASVMLDVAQSTRRVLRGEGESSAKTTYLPAEALLEDLVMALRPLAEGRQATLRAEIHLPPDAQVAASEVRSIVWNLVKNALEAIAVGGEVELSATLDGTGIVLCVRDDGAGMDAETYRRAFDRYYSTKQLGMGLGLPLVRATVDALGGTLRCDSTPDLGTSFTIRLPLPRPAVAQSGVHRRDLMQMRLLVVDGGEALVPLEALQMQGMCVHRVRSGAEARSLDGPFDIALVDALVDGGVGIELAEELRRDGAVRASIVLAADQASAEIPGIDAVVGRGRDLSEVLRSIGRIASTLPPPKTAES